jgi:hypothetical protein
MSSDSDDEVLAIDGKIMAIFARRDLSS